MLPEVEAVKGVINNVFIDPVVEEAMGTSKIWAGCVFAQKVLSVLNGKWNIDREFILLRQAIAQKVGHTAAERVVNFIKRDPATDTIKGEVGQVIWNSPESLHAGVKQMLHFRYSKKGNLEWERPVDWEFSWRGKGTKIYPNPIGKRACPTGPKRVYERPYPMGEPHPSDYFGQHMDMQGVFKEIELLDQLRDYCFELESVIGHFQEKEIALRADLSDAEELALSLAEEVEALRASFVAKGFLGKIEEQLQGICVDIRQYTGVEEEEILEPECHEEFVSPPEEPIHKDPPQSVRPLSQILTPEQLKRCLTDSSVMSITPITKTLEELGFLWDLRPDCLCFWKNGSGKRFAVAVRAQEFISPKSFLKAVKKNKFPLLNFLDLYLTRK